MPDKTDANDAPVGRTNPSGGPLGISWLMWGGLAVGTFAVIWFLKSRSSSSGTTATGDAANLPAGAGVTFVDPMTAQELLQAMQDLATHLGAGNVSPAAATSPSPGSASTLPFPGASHPSCPGTSPAN